ncbi:hypothetical protein Tco_0120693 [Tanacetum coccineum]
MLKSPLHPHTHHQRLLMYMSALENASKSSSKSEANMEQRLTKACQDASSRAYSNHFLSQSSSQVHQARLVSSSVHLMGVPSFCHESCPIEGVVKAECIPE